MHHNNVRGRDAAQNEARLASVYRLYSADVLAYALRRCSADDASDVVSETFVVAWRRIDDLPEEPAAKPWLLGVARRVLANQRRGFRRRTELVRKASTHLAPHVHEVSEIQHVGETQLIVEALRELTPRDQELLMLSAWEELTPAEISTVLGISGATVRKRLFRARKRLAAVVEQTCGENEDGDGDGERSTGSGHLPGNTTTRHPQTNGRTNTSMGKGVTAS